MTKKLKITTLGQVDIQLDGVSLSGVPAKAKALLLYLVYTRQPQTRRHLATLFYDDENQYSIEQPLGNLRTVLSELNKHLEADVLRIGREKLEFNAAYPHEVDVFELKKALQSLSQQRSPTGLLPSEVVAQATEALDFYQGEFLAHLVVRNAPEFEVWQRAEQLELEKLRRTALELLIEHTLAAKTYQPGEDYARRLLRLQPSHEKAHRLLMELLAKQGRRDEALRQYKICCEKLAEDLDVEPSPETTALYERIRTDTESVPPAQVAATTQEANAHDPEKTAMVHRALSSHEEHSKNWLADARAFQTRQGRLRFVLGQLRAKTERYFQWSAIALSVMFVALLAWWGGPQVRVWWLTQCLPHCSHGNLSELDLSGADLSRAILRWADLHNTNLSDANLHQSDLEGAALWGASLRNADLSATNLNGADLNWTELHFAKVDATTQISEKWRLVWEIVTHRQEGRDLSGVDLSKADLHEATLSDAHLHLADLHEANLWSAILTRADLRKANLNKTNLQWATLSFSKLNEADLRGANLNEANLEKADLTDAIYNDDTIWPQGFDPTAAGAKSSE